MFLEDIFFQVFGRQNSIPWIYPKNPGWGFLVTSRIPQRFLGREPANLHLPPTTWVPFFVDPKMVASHKTHGGPPAVNIPRTAKAKSAGFFLKAWVSKFGSSLQTLSICIFGHLRFLGCEILPRCSWDGFVFSPEKLTWLLVAGEII